MTTPLEEKVAAVVAKVETQKTDAASAAGATPGGKQLVQGVADAVAAVTPKTAAVTPKTAAAAVTPPPESKKEYINLAKLEAKLQAERRQFQAEVAQYKQQQVEAAERDQYLQGLQSRAKTDPAGVAKEIGLDYGSWTSQILNNGESTADQKIQALVEEIQSLRNDAQQEKEETRKQAVVRLNNEALNTVQQFRSEISSFVETNAEKYAGIQTMGIQSMVYDLIREHHKASGKLLSVAEASDILEESVVGAVEKFVASKKWQEHAAKVVAGAKGTPAGKTAAAQASKPEADREPRTLSNEMTAEAGTPTATGTAKRLTFQERINRTIASAEAKKAARL